jgi:CheY-like chemotaxis protein
MLLDVTGHGAKHSKDCRRRSRHKLIREVRGIRSSMPVVLMSGYLGPTADKVRESGLFHTLGVAQKIAAAIGADEVLQKPLSARDLATSLARVLRL